MYPHQVALFSSHPTLSMDLRSAPAPVPHLESSGQTDIFGNQQGQNPDYHGHLVGPEHVGNNVYDPPPRGIRQGGNEPCVNNTSCNNIEPAKRPMNSFILWTRGERRKMAQDNPRLSSSAISKKLGRKWKQLDWAEKRPYEDEARRLKAEYKKLNPGYNYTLANESSLSRQAGASNSFELFWRNYRNSILPKLQSGDVTIIHPSWF